MKRIILVLAVVPFLMGARTQTASRTQPAIAPGFKSEYLANFDDVARKLIDLAESIPAEKYSWRPGHDVRSISEVFTHVAGSNYFLLTFVGNTPPLDLPVDIERITDKQTVVAELKKSIAHLRATIVSVDDANLDKQVRMFGTQTTHRGVYTTILTHLHEHLGQSIAYARMNGVTPPWSR